MSISKRLLQGASVTLLSIASAIAYADSSTAVQFQHGSLVRFSDLNLDRPGDVVRLYDRIAAAADKVCGPRTLTGSYSKSSIYASCYSDAVGQAIARIDKPALTAYYRERTQPVLRALANAR